MKKKMKGYEKADAKKDKKKGIREGSKVDNSLDRKGMAAYNMKKNKK